MNLNYFLEIFQFFDSKINQSSIDKYFFFQHYYIYHIILTGEGNKMSQSQKKHLVSLSFEGIHLPPFRDILILTKKCPQGKNGLFQCMSLMGFENFKLIDIEDEIVEALLVNQKILKKMNENQIIKILKDKVFPSVEKGELIKVDFNLKIIIDEIEIKRKN